MTLNELIKQLEVLCLKFGGHLPVYIDKNKYEISQELRVWHCEKREDELEHIHLKPVYTSED